MKKKHVLDAAEIVYSGIDAIDPVEGPRMAPLGPIIKDDTRTFRFGPVEVTELACESAALVAAALRRNGWPGKPRPCRRPACALRRESADVGALPLSRVIS